MPRLPAVRDRLLALLDARSANKAERAERLDRVIAEHGWPGLRLVGADAADAAWWLACQADDADVDRAAWLDALRAAVESGDADPRHLATLTDRVAASSGRPQRYGTLVLLATDGELEFTVPVEDPGAVDERREQIGLGPVDADARYMADGELVPFSAERRDVPVTQWPIVLEGHVSAEAALHAGVRRVHRIWGRRPGDRRLGRLRAMARERGVMIEQVDDDVIDEVTRGRTHGGVVALVGPRPEPSVGELLAEVGEGSFVVMLDGIEDPFNFGQAVRALYAAGVDGIVVRRSWETAAGTITRASGGTTELMPLGWATTADEAAERCRAAGMRVACAVSDDRGRPLHEADLRGGVFLLIGGERRGITRSFVDRADELIRIHYGRPDAPDLGAAASAAVIGFEALRQRGRRGD